MLHLFKTHYKTVKLNFCTIQAFKKKKLKMMWVTYWVFYLIDILDFMLFPC